MTKTDLTDAKNGRFDGFGGQYIPEPLMSEINRVKEAYLSAKKDSKFQKELQFLLHNYAGRPSLLYYAKNMTRDLGGAKIYLKREDMNHTGAHKINNTLGQGLLAKRMGKTHLMAETGAGQHGVATAAVAALFNMRCDIFMGKRDTERQLSNVYRMKLLGAHVHPVSNGSGVLKDAINVALGAFAKDIATTHDAFYVLGSAVGPSPYPEMVKDFQSVISKESKKQIIAKEGKLPDAIVACVGGGSNAIGAFANYINDPSVSLIGVEGAGQGVDTNLTAATIEKGRTGIFQGMKTYFLQNKTGQIKPVYSIAAGLDYPGVGPQHVALATKGRAKYVGINDDEAVHAYKYIAKEEGIIAAIESCHAVAYAMKMAPKMRKDQIIIVNLSGRGDKDAPRIAKYIENKKEGK